MNEQLPLPTDNEHSQEAGSMNRRRVLRGAVAGLVFVSAGGVGLNKLLEDGNNQPVDGQLSLDMSPVSTETPSNAEYDQTVAVPLGNAEVIRKKFETMTPEVFSEEYNLTTKNARTPSEIVDVITTRITDIASIGCNPTEVTSGITPEAYLYAIAGLCGIKAEDVVAEEIEGSHMYKVISELREVVLEHYTKAVENGSSAGMAFSVKYIGDDKQALETTSNRGGQGEHGIEVELEAVITAPEAEPIILPANFWLDFTVPNVEPGKTYLNSGPRVMGIVLNESLTKPFGE